MTDALFYGWPVLAAGYLLLAGGRSRRAMGVGLAGVGLLAGYLLAVGVAGVMWADVGRWLGAADPAAGRRVGACVAAAVLAAGKGLLIAAVLVGRPKPAAGEPA